MKFLIRILVITGILYVALGELLFSLQDKFLFHPQTLPSDYRFNYPYDFAEINLPAENKITVNALLIKADKSK